MTTPRSTTFPLPLLNPHQGSLNQHQTHWVIITGGDGGHQAGEGQ